METVELRATAPFEVALTASAVPEAVPPGCVLFRTERSLISAGTELALVMGTHIGFQTGAAWPRYPVTLGYTAVGYIVRVGEGVTDFHEDDCVLAEARHASYSIVETSRLLRVAADCDLDAALLAHLASIPMYGLRQARVQLGEGLVVFGLGLIGTLGARLGWLAGCRPVLGVDPVSERRALAAKAHIVSVDPRDDDPADIHRRLTRGRLPEVVVEATGIPAVLCESLRAAAPMARVVLLGSPRGRVELDPYTDIHRKGVTVIGVHDSFTPTVATPHAPFSADRERSLALDLLADGSLIVDGLISHHIGPGDALATYRMLAAHDPAYMGVVIDWSTLT